MAHCRRRRLLPLQTDNLLEEIHSLGHGDLAARIIGVLCAIVRCRDAPCLTRVLLERANLGEV